MMRSSTILTISRRLEHVVAAREGAERAPSALRPVSKTGSGNRAASHELGGLTRTIEHQKGKTKRSDTQNVPATVIDPAATMYVTEQRWLTLNSAWESE